MRFVKSLLLCLSLAMVGNLQAQDIHFAQFYCSPLTLNPALTGSFKGTYRVGGIYRTQWNNLATNGFQTPSIYVDAPIIRGFRKTDWVGVGGMFYNDKRGAGGLSDTYAGLSASYHLGLDKKGRSVLTLGAQGGVIQRKLATPEGLRFEDELDINGGGESMDRALLLQDNPAKFDLNIGLSLTSSFGKKGESGKMNLGFAVKHLMSPDINLVTASATEQDSVDLPLRINVHGKFDFPMGEKMTLSPRFLYSAISGASETVVQAIAGYKINPTVKLNVGLGYRFQDALQILVGMNFKDIHVGIAYDANVSSLKDAGVNRAGFELCASYIGKIYKTPEPPPVILCPRF